MENLNNDLNNNLNNDIKNIKLNYIKEGDEIPFYHFSSSSSSWIPFLENSFLQNSSFVRFFI